MLLNNTDDLQVISITHILWPNAVVAAAVSQCHVRSPYLAVALEFCWCCVRCHPDPAVCSRRHTMKCNIFPYLWCFWGHSISTSTRPVVSLVFHQHCAPWTYATAAPAVILHRAPLPNPPFTFGSFPVSCTNDLSHFCCDVVIFGVMINNPIPLSQGNPLQTFFQNNHHKNNFNGNLDPDAKSISQHSGRAEKGKIKSREQPPDRQKSENQYSKKEKSLAKFPWRQSPQKYLQRKSGPRRQINVPTLWRSWKVKNKVESKTPKRHKSWNQQSKRGNPSKNSHGENQHKITCNGNPDWYAKAMSQHPGISEKLKHQMERKILQIKIRKQTVQRGLIPWKLLQRKSPQNHLQW